MITIFATPKAFTGEFAAIQRNAITSWTLLRPQPQVILFGNEEGTAAISRELQVTHIPDVATNEFGTPLVGSLFSLAEHRSPNRLLCYLNSDVILLSDFMAAVNTVSELDQRFLMVGKRCTVGVNGEIDFEEAGWEERLRTLASSIGEFDSVYHIDYFVFSKGLYSDLPPFVIGRPAYDNWLIWKARALGAVVIDATAAVLPIHQRHGYSHVSKGHDWVWHGDEARRNRELAGSLVRIRTLGDATHMLLPDGHLRRARGAVYRAARLRVWRDLLLEVTRPLRARIGLTGLRGRE